MLVRGKLRQEDIVQHNYSFSLLSLNLTYLRDVGNKTVEAHKATASRGLKGDIGGAGERFVMRRI